MDDLKKRFGLTTDRGGDLQAAVYLVVAAVIGMEPGAERSGLLALCILCLALVSYLTRGHEALLPERREDDQR